MCGWRLAQAPVTPDSDKPVAILMHKKPLHLPRNGVYNRDHAAYLIVFGNRNGRNGARFNWV